MRRKILLLTLTVVLIGIMGISYLQTDGYKDLLEPERGWKKVASAELVDINIEAGSGISSVADQLKEHGIIKNPKLFALKFKLNKMGSNFKYGAHKLAPSMSYTEIGQELSKTPLLPVHKFTIPEGFELVQIAERLDRAGIVDKDDFIHAAENIDYNYDFLYDLPLDKFAERKYKLEGYLFPDTYEVLQTAKAEDIIKKMLDRFDQVFEQQYYERARELNMTADDIVTLASVIEREALSDEDRREVSSVFHNRLKSNEYKYLQSCATVQYILGERKAVLSEKDTQIKSPYNTYINAGLPVGPIASPGKASIEAALYPEQTNYYFFVLGKDGKHIFTQTYQQHLKAMQ